MRQRILVVEDEPAILDLVAEVLADEGFDVERAANGADALATIGAERMFDLVVLDMWMPEVNGWQFASALTERGMRIPLLVMTAASNARTCAQDVGAIGYIGKPFDVDQLVLAVRQAVPAGSRRQDDEEPPAR